MAVYGPDDIIIAFDDSGGTPQTMTQYVLEMSGVDREALLMQTNSFGDTSEEWTAVGVTKVGEITLKGIFDDTASTGPNAIFIAIGNTTTRTLTITWGSTKTTAVECIIKSYRRMPRLGETTQYEVVLRPTGAVTEN